MTLRSRIEHGNIRTICLHHEQVLLTKYSTLKRKCCDPCDLHPNKSKTKSLKVVSINYYERLINPPPTITPGEKLCPTCYIKVKDTRFETVPLDEPSVTSSPSADPGNLSTPSASDVDTDVEAMMSSPEKDTSLLDLNASLVRLGETPVKAGHLAPSSRKRKAKEKYEKSTKKLRSELEKQYHVPLESSDSEDECDSHDLKLYRQVFDELKEKFRNSDSYAERVQILTLSPFTIERTMQEFKATNYMVKKSRAVRKEKGILGACDKNRGKPLSEELKGSVVSFYEMDENSRVCPGKKDKVSIRGKDGEKIEHQKRLVLSNLKELHVAWKTAHPDQKVGFSSFAALRPKWCVLAGASGTHSVCVCKYHQNPKLMAASCLSYSVQDLMSKAVCSLEEERCMMGQCKECPGRQGVIDFLSNSDDLVDMEEVTYRQWVSVDRTKLVTILEPKDEFIENLAEKIVTLTRHSFTAKSQSAYMNNLKTNLKPTEEIILQGDFAENFSYVVQDEIQSFHWENSQATLHPFVAYYRLEDGTLEHINICILSDCRDHTTVTVYAFLKVALACLKTKLPDMKKVHYFTDGCGGQYKNKYNFINLCHHQVDFGLEAEWNFFATSHGKSACDGIGGTVKRLVTKRSLQCLSDSHILTSLAMFDFCVENIPGIQFFHVPMDDVASCEDELKPRFNQAQTIKGTLQFHRFVPASQTTMRVYKLSQQTNPPDLVAVQGQQGPLCDEDEGSADDDVPLVVRPQNFACCSYDNVPWIGLVEEVSEEFGDYKIKFMHPHGPAKTFYWPSRDDCCWIPESDLHCVISAPFLKSSSTRNYSISHNDLARISNHCLNWPIDKE